MAEKGAKPMEYFIGRYSGKLSETATTRDGYSVTVTDSRFPSFVKKFASIDDMLNGYISKEFKKNWMVNIQFSYAFESSIDPKNVSKMIKKIRQYYEDSLIPSST